MLPLPHNNINYNNNNKNNSVDDHSLYKLSLVDKSLRIIDCITQANKWLSGLAHPTTNRKSNNFQIRNPELFTFFIILIHVLYQWIFISLPCFSLFCVFLITMLLYPPTFFGRTRSVQIFTCFSKNLQFIGCLSFDKYKDNK